MSCGLALQVKAVLDQMTDAELKELVAQQPATAAGVLASAGEPVTEFEQQQQQQQQQHMMMMQMQPAAVPQQQQQQQVAAATAAVPDGSMPPPAASLNVTMQMTVGGAAAPDGWQQGQQRQQQHGSTAGSAAAGLSALFADADGGGNPLVGKGTAAGDVTLAHDQLSAFEMLNMSVDSFTGELCVMCYVS
jgi:hypothetical protein